MDAKNEKRRAMKKDLERIEYHILLSNIASHTFTEGARERVLSLAPLKDKKEIEKRQKFLKEWENRKSIPLTELSPFYEVLKKKTSEGFLSGKELLRFSEGVKSFEKIKERITRFKDGITEIAEKIKETHPIREEIDRVIDKDGAVKTEASEKLKKIREGMYGLRKSILSILRKEYEKNPEYFWDENMYFREGRYLLSLKREYEPVFKGVVIDYSETGRAVFVEPFEVVEYNNRLKNLLEEEKKEEKRIIKELNEKLDKERELFLAIRNFIEEMDFLRAVSLFSERINAKIPRISDKIFIRNGRHPLLCLHKDVVPFTLHMNDKKVLLISGPNAGGKTVLLKSVGLITAMGLSGLPVPADETTELPLFETLFVDLGDEQSIDEDLSTFTAHLLNIKRITEKATDKSLVLLDELGTSTSPNEGAALGSAILSFLSQKNATVIATTHLESLKIFVESRKDMLNGGMGWKKGPTYKLFLGFPGTSNAIEVSEGIGLNKRIIEDAKKLADKGVRKIEELMRKLIKEKEKVIQEKEELQKLKSKYMELKERYECIVERLKKRIKGIEKNYTQKKRNEILEKRKEMENLIKEIRESQASKESIRKAKKFFEKVVKETKVFHENKNLKNLFKEGDIVFVKRWNKKGIIVERGKEGYLVNIDGKKLSLSEDELSPSGEDSKITVCADYTFRPVLNIRGMSAEDARLRVIEFIEEAWSLGISRIWILHGKGKGILKRMVFEIAKSDSRIKDVRVGEPNEGGEGTTVISLC